MAARLDGAGTAVFAPPLDEELAVLPELRRVAAVSAAAALLIALALGAALAARIARPVQQLAGAAAAFGAGDLAAPIASSSIREVDQMATTFTDMRSALVARLAELRDANAALTDRNTDSRPCRRTSCSAIASSPRGDSSRSSRAAAGHCSNPASTIRFA